MIAALLLGRKGSIGFPGKNTFRVLGRPMASYPMRAAHQATLVDTGYLSTDDPEPVSYTHLTLPTKASV